MEVEENSKPRIYHLGQFLSQSNQQKRIVISGGGTGGHLYPGLAVADEFRACEDQVLYLGSKSGLEAEVVPKAGYEFYPVPGKGIAGSPFKKLKALLSLGLGVIKATWKLKEWRPDLVVGTGGFVCVPAVAAAALLGVPIVLLEQNAVPGKATKFLSRFAKRVCLSFEDSARFFPGCETTWTGNPLRSQIATVDRSEARQKLGLDSGRPTLLVAGASQGAASINGALLSCLKVWKDRDWNIIHLTGRNHLARVRAQAEGLEMDSWNLCYRSFGFRSDMEVLYSASDLVVSRAGATTIAELTCLGLPAVFVPYPYAGAHQKENAKVVVETGGARQIPDELVEEKLKIEIESLLEDSSSLLEMSSKSRATAQPEASRNVMNVCREVMN